MAELDVELDILLAQWEYFKAHPEDGALSIGPDDPVYVSLRCKGDPAALASAGFTVGSIVGPIAYGATTLAGLAALAQHPQVEQISKQRRQNLTLDGSIPEIRANTAWTRSGQNFSGYTGRGVIIGVVDTGIDFRHRTFRNPDQTTRVFRIWDQTLTPQPGEQSPGAITDAAIATTPTPLGYGVEYKGETFNTNNVMEAPRGEAPVRHVDTNGHGTHVAGIAAGDGSQGGHCHGENTFVGVAPHAELIIVRMWNLTQGDPPQPPTNSNVMVDAIRYIFNEAKKVSKPAVVNLSIGKFSDIMDGTGNVCAAVDTLLQANSVGRAVVFAAGNDGASGFHATSTISAGGSVQLKFSISSNDGKARNFSVLYNGGHLRARVLSPEAGSAGHVPPDAPGNPRPWLGPAVGTVTSPNANGGGTGSAVTLQTRANKINLGITPPTGGNNSGGTWTLELQDTANTPGGTLIDAFCLFGSSHDENSPRWHDNTTSRMTLSEHATGRECITVGSYREGGGLSSFSSRGPTRHPAPPPGSPPAPAKPELAAPGESIASASIPKDRMCERCCCACCHDFYVDKDGTSMAAPHIAGVIALMLHKNPNLTHTEIKTLLTSHTSPKPADSSPDQDLGWGAGRVNVFETMNAVAQVNPPIARVAAAQDALVALHAELMATERGPVLQGLFQKYASEVWTLIQENRRVATTWHRCGGPMWVRLALKAAHMPEAHIPLRVDDFDFHEALRRFASALKRFGSAAMGADIAVWEGEAARIEAGMSLKDIIEAVGNQPLPAPTAGT